MRKVWLKVKSRILFGFKILNDFKEVFFGTANYGFVNKSINQEFYPIDYSFTLKNKGKYYSPMDKEGLPMANYLNFGICYNPTRVATFGLAHYNEYLGKKNKNDLDVFLKVADWFVEFSDGRFVYEMPYGELKSPWISCMAQGQGISILVRAFKLTGNESYLNIAKNAVITFKLNIENGGLRSLINNQFVFLEEFPFKQPRHVLNGFNYALIGIMDLNELVPEIYSEMQFFNFLNAVQNWKFWHYKNWTTYDLHVSKKGRRNFATITYQKVHISQFKYLNEKFPDKGFNDCVRQLERDYNNIFYRFNAFIFKIKYRLDEKAARF